MRPGFSRSVVFTLTIFLMCLTAGQLRAEYVSVPPPPLPSYDQPAIPGPGYVWVPGNWAYDQASGYYWVPGTWVIPPKPGVLWTPSYWSFNKELDAYGFHQGYWAEQVGFYGGIAYGFGYPGTGYGGGYWRGGDFFYNRLVNNLADASISTVFSQPVALPASPVSFLGGPGGINIQITPQQAAVSKLPHLPPTPDQRQQVTNARSDPGSHESNGGPKVGGTSIVDHSHGPAIRSPKTTSAATVRPRGNNQRGSHGGEIVTKGGDAATGAAGEGKAGKTAEAPKGTTPVGVAGAAGDGKAAKTGETPKVTPPVGAAGTGGEEKAGKTEETPKVAPGKVAGTSGEQENRRSPGQGKPFRIPTGERLSGTQKPPPSRVQSVRIAPPRSVGVAPPRVGRVAPPRVSRVAPPRVSRVAPPRVNRRVAPPRVNRRVAPPRVNRVAPRRVNRVAPRRTNGGPQRRR